MTENGTVLSEDSNGVLYRHHPIDETLLQVVLAESLRSLFLRLAHSSPLDGHRSHTHMHVRLHGTFV